MPTPRLAKLTRPRTDGLVARTRLFKMLDAACARPVVWIAGPPVQKVLAQPDLQKSFASTGAEVTGGTPEAFARFFADER